MPTIDIQQAANSAANYFSELLKAREIRLEEVEASGDDHLWYVTLSGLIPIQKLPSNGIQDPGASALAALFKEPDTERILKVFTVDANDGHVRSMKIRKEG